MNLHRMSTYLVSAIFIALLTSCTTNDHTDQHDNEDDHMNMMEQDAMENELHEDAHNPNHFDHDSLDHSGDHMMDDGHMNEDDHMHDHGDPN